MKRIIIVEHEPLIKTTERNFYIQELLQEGFEVEYWDVSKIVHETLQIVDELSTPYLKKIETIDSFNILISEYSANSIFIVEVFETWNARGIFKILNDFRVTSIRIDTYATAVVPLQPKHKLLYLRSASYMIRGLKKKILRWKLEKFYKENNIFKYNILFTSANIASNSETEIIRINSRDYEKYLEDSPLENLFPNDKYCVFLDECLPFHPETIYITKEKGVDPGRYFALMNRLFDHIERTLKIKVVIASHPKSEYNADTFKGRPIIKYKSSQLAKYAEFVIVHGSLSFHFGIFNYKPIVFAAFKELRKRFIAKFAVIKYRAEFLDQPIQMLDHLDAFRISPVDRERYDAFKYQFLSAVEIEHVRNKDIILDKIKQIASV